MIKLPSEFEEQKALMKWAKLNTKKYPCLKFLFSSLNGVRLSIGAAVKAKQTGLVPGVPDVCLPAPRGPYFGLWIELKRVKGGKLSPEQIEFGKYLNDAGYKWVCCCGARHAVETIVQYLSLQNESNAI